MIGPYLTDSYEGEAYIGSADEPKDGVRVQMYSGSNERGIGCNVASYVCYKLL